MSIRIRSGCDSLARSNARRLWVAVVDLVALVGQDVREHPHDVRVVVHYQDAAHSLLPLRCLRMRPFGRLTAPPGLHAVCRESPKCIALALVEPERRQAAGAGGRSQNGGHRRISRGRSTPGGWGARPPGPPARRGRDRRPGRRNGCAVGPPGRPAGAPRRPRRRGTRRRRASIATATGKGRGALAPGGEEEAVPVEGAVERGGEDEGVAPVRFLHRGAQQGRLGVAHGEVFEQLAGKRSTVRSASSTPGDCPGRAAGRPTPRGPGWWRTTARPRRTPGAGRAGSALPGPVTGQRRQGERRARTSAASAGRSAAGTAPGTLRPQAPGEGAGAIGAGGGRAGAAWPFRGTSSSPPKTLCSSPSSW